MADENDILTTPDEDPDGSSGDDSRDKKERACSICRRPESKAGPLTALPGGMFVCRDCMQRSFDAFQNNLNHTDMNTLMENLTKEIGSIDLSQFGIGGRTNPQKKEKKKQ